MMDIEEAYKEMEEIECSLTEGQLKNKEAFVDSLEEASHIFGCGGLLTLYRQAWFLSKGYKLKHCNYKTAEELLGMTTDNICKLHEHLGNTK